MKKSILLIILLALITTSYSIGVIPVKDAKKVSENFLTEKVGVSAAKSLSIDLQYTETDANGDPVYYRFQIGQKGFMIVSATDLVLPVLAFSMESNYKQGTSADYLFGKYKEQINYVKQNPTAAVAGVEKAWKYYLTDNFVPKYSKSYGSLEPLVTTLWTQETYYNTQCPVDQNASGGYDWDMRTPVGCVALTMMNILNYYRYPTSGYGGVSYIPAVYNEDNTEILYSYPRQTANFGQSFYNYDAIYDDLSNYCGELEELVHHCGISVKMGYSPDGSGAQSEDALVSLKDYWFYAQSAQIIDREDISSDSLWIEEFIGDLRAHRPLYYSGQSESLGGHAWIVDGFFSANDNYYFHCNWGWAGYANGFFLINNLMTPPSSGGSFSDGESVMVGLVPYDSTLVEKPATSFVRNTAAAGSISDGAGNMKYANNSQRSWMIATPHATAYRFSFRKIKTEENQDIITIYNGPTVESGIRAQYSGNYLMPAAQDYSSISGYPADSVSFHSPFTGQALPGDVLVNADSVLIVFSSNASNNDYGFLINYEATNFNLDKCANLKTLSNEVHYILTDKLNSETSDDTPYRAAGSCSWLIKPTFVSGYVCNFRKFNLKEGDFIDIYDYTSQSDPIFLKRFDNLNLPTGNFNLNASRLRVNFISDNWQEGNGFELEYYAVVGIDEESGINNLSVYPNPASDNITLTLSTENAENIMINIMDMTGKLLYTENVNHQGGELNYQLSVNQFASGIYFIQINTSTGKTIRKFIVE